MPNRQQNPWIAVATRLCKREAIANLTQPPEVDCDSDLSVDFDIFSEDFGELEQNEVLVLATSCTTVLLPNKYVPFSFLRCSLVVASHSSRQKCLVGVTSYWVLCVCACALCVWSVHVLCMVCACALCVYGLCVCSVCVYGICVRVWSMHVLCVCVYGLCVCSVCVWSVHVLCVCVCVNTESLRFRN